MTVSPHLSIRGVRCFTLLRKDGSVKNFSYRKTLAAMLGDGWEGYQLPELVRLQQLVSAGKDPSCTVAGVVKHVRFSLGLLPHTPTPHGCWHMRPLWANRSVVCGRACNNVKLRVHHVRMQRPAS